MTEIMFAQMKLPEIVKKVKPAIASVHVYDENDEILQYGSGFFINHDGHFITNRHVITGGFQAHIKN